MDKLTEQEWTGVYNWEIDVSISEVINNAVIAVEFNKLIEEVNKFHYQMKNLKEIQKWKNWRFR